MRVLVAGGTGFIGTALCETLAASGHAVSAFARSPDGPDLPADVDAVQGDVSDPEGLTETVADHDAVVNLVALSPLFKPRMANGHDIVHRQGTEHLLAAAESAGVDRFVQMSAIGADPEGSTAYLRAKGRAESATREADLEWTILRPSVVFGDGDEFLAFAKWVSFPPMTHRLLWPHVSPLPGARARFQPIWVGDVAAMVAEAATTPDHAGETYELGGPEVYTLAEIVRLVHAAEGKPARLVAVPNTLAKAGLTVTEHVPGFPLGADQGRALDLDNVAERNGVAALGRPVDELRPLEDYLGLA